MYTLKSTTMEGRAISKHRVQFESLTNWASALDQRKKKRSWYVFIFTTNAQDRINIPSQLPPQWINCDVRRFDYTVLGKFHVIMADPPWDIHMSVCIIC